MNVSEVIARRARSDPDAPAVLIGDWRMSNAEAEAAVQRVAARLAREGIAPSDLVGLSARASPAVLLLAILGLARLGAILVPILPSITASKRDAIAEHFRLAAVLTDDGERRGAAGVRSIALDGSWLTAAGGGAAPAAHPGGAQPWCITLTSGTTGAPKGVVRTHAEFLEVAALQSSLAGIGPDARFLSFMDLHNGPAIKRTLRQLACGGPVVFLDAKFPGSPAPIERHGVTHLYASPAMMQMWLDMRPRGLPRFATLRQLVVGTGAVAPALEREIVERITPRLFLNYGTTETGSAAVLGPQERERHPGAAGRIVPWIEAQVVDENDRALPAGRSGALRFRGKGVATGYYGIGAGSDTGARGFRDGWFYPGDLARIDEDRLLYVEGRVDDIINLGGPKLNAAEVEAVFARHPSVREAAAFAAKGADGQPCVVVAVAVRGAFDDAALARHYREQDGRYGTRLRIVEVRALPRSAAGKVLKHELKQLTGF